MSGWGFRQRFQDAQARVARLNRSDIGVQTLEGPGSEERLERIQQRFEGVSLRRTRGPNPSGGQQRPVYASFGSRSRVDKTALGLGLWLIAWATCVGIAASIVLAQFTPERTLGENLRHVAAVPNGAAARMAGVAPAYRGEPGYWSGHDRDKDGVACEPLPEHSAEGLVEGD